MLPIEAKKLLIVEGVEDDPLTKAAADRLLTGISAQEVIHVDDEKLSQIVAEDLTPWPRHGMQFDDPAIVIFNRFRFDDSEEERTRRIDAYPNLNQLKFNGYGGFDWRDSGSPAYRERTGGVCQPAWQIHTICGCHFRCAYCNLGHCLNIMLNMEDYVSRLPGWIDTKCPKQTLFQWDNVTDTVCFEPEFGATKLLIDFFATRPGQALELYVGKSDNVDFMLDYDHRGHTVCCWSVSTDTQSRHFEHRAASMEERIEAIRKCQQAGYAVRVRFSPIVPVKNWRQEHEDMIKLLFDRTVPDVLTIETLRYMDYNAVCAAFDTSLLDDEFLEAIKGEQGKEVTYGSQIPDWLRKQVYEFVFEQVDRYGTPATKVAFCREQRTMWDAFEATFAKHGQTPDRYVCNCGPFSAPATAGELEPAAAG